VQEEAEDCELQLSVSNCRSGVFPCFSGMRCFLALGGLRSAADGIRAWTVDELEEQPCLYTHINCQKLCITNLILLRPTVIVPRELLPTQS
jgi:hypothetical protein